MAALRSFPALEPYAQLPCALVGIGGRALDLWIGRQTRAHQDVDVAILRDDQNQLHEVFGGWELYYATTDHRLVSYRSDRWLEEPLHGVWVRPASDAAWLCEFLLNEHENQQWVYRRNPAVRKPLAEVGLTALGRVPILVPEIVLLYKAHELTEKDEADFRSALPHLTPSQKAWLLGYAGSEPNLLASHRQSLATTPQCCISSVRFHPDRLLRSRLLSPADFQCRSEEHDR